MLWGKKFGEGHICAFGTVSRAFQFLRSFQYKHKIQNKHKIAQRLRNRSEHWHTGHKFLDIITFVCQNMINYSLYRWKQIVTLQRFEEGHIYDFMFRAFNCLGSFQCEHELLCNLKIQNMSEHWHSNYKFLDIITFACQSMRNYSRYCWQQIVMFWEREYLWLWVDVSWI